MNWRTQYEELEERYGVQFDWATDKCSGAPDRLLNLDISEPCSGHDFVYRNWWRLEALGIKVSRRQTDAKLHTAIDEQASGFWVHIIASAYQAAVRTFGWIAWYGNRRKAIKKS